MAALSVVRVNLAEVGLNYLIRITKHDIKRVDRLLGNYRILVSQARFQVSVR